MKVFTRNYLLAPLFFAALLLGWVHPAHAQSFVEIGTGTSSSYFYGPLYRSSSASTFDYSNYVYLYTPADLAGVPAGALITRVDWDIVSTNAMTGANTLRIHAENTTQTTVGVGDNWTAQVATATLVYDNNAYSVPGTAGWMAHTFSTPFIYTGANLKLAVDHFRGGTAAGVINYAVPGTAEHTGLAGGISASTNTQSTAFTASYSNRRPNIRIYYTLPTGLDAAVQSIVSPVAPVSAGIPFPVTFTLSNFAADPVTSASISYQLNGGAVVTESWNGNLLTGTSQNVTFAANVTVPAGTSTLRVWISNINGLGNDANQANDTLATTFCTALAAGTYTIGGVGADYGSPQAAINDLVSCGIAGQVILSVNPGTGPYPQNLVIPEIIGAGPASRVVLRGNGETIEAISGDVIYLNGADYITIENFRILNTATANASGIRLNNGADHNIIQNNVVLMDSANTTSTTYAGIILSSGTGMIGTGQNGNFNQILNNTVSGAYYGITLYGTSATVQVEGNEAIGNTVREFRFDGIRMYFQRNGKVNNNVLSSRANASTTGEAIWVSGSDVGQVNGNLIERIGGYGLYFSASNAGGLGRFQVINNVVLDNFIGTTTKHGISIVGGLINADIFHNSVAVSGGTTNAVRAFSLSSTLAAGLDVRNNSFAVYNNPLGLALFASSSASFTTLDFNNYFSDNSSGLLNVNGTVLTPATYVGANGQNQNSRDGNPGYTNPVADLTPQTGQLNNWAALSVGVSEDFLGVSRPITPGGNDVGAIEFTLASGLNASLPVFISPVTGSAAGTPLPVTVTLRNDSTDAITSVVLNYSLNGGPTVTQTFTVNILGGLSEDLTFTGTITLPQGNNSIVAWVSSVNGLGPDPVQAGDTVRFDFCTGLSGVYTIGPAGDFATPLDAVNALVACGIGGPVFISAAAGAGPFTDPIVIPEIVGASNINRITLDGGPDRATISRTGNGPVILLEGADFFTISNWTVISTGTASTIAVQLRNGADFNIINGNTVLMDSALGTTITTVGGICVAGGTSPSTTTTGSYNQISNNLVVGGALPYSAVGTSTTVRQSGNRFENNEARQYVYRGVFASNNDSIVITNNTLHARTPGSTTGAGVWLITSLDAEVTANHILNPGQYGIYLSNVTASAGNNSRVVNNMVTGKYSSTGVRNAMLLTGTTANLNVYHNSLVAEGLGSTTPPRSMYLETNVTGVNIRNNSLAVVDADTSEVFFTVNAAAPSQLDYNNYFTEGTRGFMRIGSANPYDAVSFVGVGGYNLNSLVGNPQFNDIRADLRAAGGQLNDVGDNSVGVADDIFGNPRPIIPGGTVDIGAHEFTPALANLALTAYIKPATSRGRRFTSLGFAASDTVIVEVTNLGIATQTNFPITYVLNGGAPVTETVTAVISPGNSISYAFTTLISPNVTGQNTLQAWHSLAGDSDTSNDTLPVFTFEQIANDPVTLPYFQGFEAMADTTINGALNLIVGLNGALPFDFQTSQPQGRLRTVPSTTQVFARTGDRSITMDRLPTGSPASINSLLMTLNMSNYDANTDKVVLDFSYIYHGTSTVVHPNNQIWVRGNDQAAWISIFDLFQNRGTNGVHQFVEALEVSDALVAGGQNFSSSFQVRFGQEHTLSATSLTASAGITFDDIELRQIVNRDAGVVELVLPTGSICSAPDVRVRVRNFGFDSLRNYTINWTVNGAAQAPITITGDTLGFNDISVPRSLGTFAFSDGVAYTLRFWTTNPNGQPDQQPTNDTLQFFIPRFTYGLSGAYTVGGVSPDFPDLTSLEAGLQLSGVCGNTIINFRPGTYTGRVVMENVPGLDGSNTITFRSENANAAGVIITDSATTTANNGLFFLRNAERVTFEHLTFRPRGASFARAIDFDASHNLTVRNCVFEGPTTTTLSFNTAHIYSPNVLDSNILIRDNVFRGNSGGIQLDGLTTNEAAGIAVLNNIFDGIGSRAMLITGTRSIIVRGNNIHLTGTSVAYGIQLSNAVGAFRVLENQLLLNAQDGINIFNSFGDTTALGIVANNVVNLPSSSALRTGLQLSGSRNVDVLFNTIRINSSSATSRCVFIGGTTANMANLRLQNNNFVNDGAGLTYSATATYTPFVTVSNYNNHFSNGANLASWGGVNRADLGALQAASGLEANSVSVDPIFTSGTNLRPLSPTFDNLGTPFGGITQDVAGQSRSNTTPDIGAYEFSPRLRDVAIVSLDNPAFGGCGRVDQKIDVTVRNLGTQILFNIPIVVQVTGAQTLTLFDTIPGPIQALGNVSRRVASLNTLTAGTYNFVVYANLPLDEERGNDTVAGTFAFNTPTSVPPIVSDVAVCLGQTAVLVGATVPAEEVLWFANPSTDTILSVGDTLVLPGLTQNDTVYAASAEYANYTVGPPNSTSVGAGGNVALYYGQIFTAFIDFTIDSVRIEPSSTGSFIIKLETAGGAVLQQRTINVTSATPQYIAVGFNVSQGVGLRLMADNFSGVNMFRNTSGATFPYTVPGIVSVTDNTFNNGTGSYPGYWYYFYDWKISAVGCPSARVPVAVTVNPAPVADLGADQFYCGVGSQAFTLNNPGSTTTWALNTGALGSLTATTGETTSYNVLNAGSSLVADTLTVTVVAGNGCETTDQVILRSNPSLSVSLPATVSFNCGDSTLVQATVTGGTAPYTYQWVGGPAADSLWIKTAGSFELQVTDAQGCVSTATVTSSFNFSTLALVMPANQAICAGESVTLGAAVSGGSLPYSFSWSTGSTDSALTFTTGGTYTLTVTDGAGCDASGSFTLTLNPIPTVTLGADINACVGQTVTLTPSGTSGASYLWSTGATTATLPVTTAGEYWVQATVNGCSRRDTIQVSFNPTPDITGNATACANTSESYATSVPGTWSIRSLVGSTLSNVTSVGVTVNFGFTPNPLSDTLILTTTDGCRDTLIIGLQGKPEVLLGANQTICDGTPITLDAGNPGATYLWSTGATTQTLSVSSAGTYFVEVTRNGCIGRDTVVVTTNPSPVVDLGADRAVCGNTTLDAGNAGAAFVWSTGATTQTLNVTTSGTYSVTVTQGGCSSTDNVVITVNPAPSVNLGPDQTVCGSTTLDAGNPGATYLWSTGATTQTISVSTSGNYSVTVTANGCDATDDVQVTITPAPVVNLGPDISTCATNATLDAGNPGLTFNWSTGESTQTISVTVDGIYWVDVTDGSCTTRDSINVALNTGALTVNLGADRTICDGASVTLDAGNPGASYVWSTGATTQTITVSASGTYSVTVSQNGCTGTDEVQVTVNALPTASITAPDTTITASATAISGIGSAGASLGWNFGSDASPATATGAGPHNVTWSTPGNKTLTLTAIANGCTTTVTQTIFVNQGTGLAPAFAQFVRVYPNPSHGQFTLEALLPEALETELLVTSLTGQIVYRQVIPAATEIRLPVELNVALGTYQVILRSAKGQVSHKLVIH